MDALTPFCSSLTVGFFCSVIYYTYNSFVSLYSRWLTHKPPLFCVMFILFLPHRLCLFLLLSFNRESRLCWCNWCSSSIRSFIWNCGEVVTIIALWFFPFSANNAVLVAVLNPFFFFLKWVSSYSLDSLKL